MRLAQVRNALATLAMVVPLAAVAAPANADTTGLFNLAVGNCGAGSAQLCSGYGQGVPVGLSSLRVAGVCSATSTGVVDRTGVGCYLRGLSDGKQYLNTGSVFLAGNTAAVPIQGSVPFQGYALCVGAGFSTTTGGGAPVANYRCT